MGKVPLLGSLHTPSVPRAKTSQGFPSQSAQTCAKGTVCLILGPTQGHRAGGEEEVGALGQCWDCERPMLLVSAGGDKGWGCLIFPLCPPGNRRDRVPFSRNLGIWLFQSSSY